MADNHPTESELQARAEFRLSLNAAKVVDDHLRVCPACNAGGCRGRERANKLPA
jgi:hypothetical protein